MNVSKDEIYNTCVNIMTDARVLTNHDLQNKYYDFKEKFLKLYEMCAYAADADKPYILGELKKLLNIREEVISGTKEEIAANVQVGEYVAKKHLYPVIGEPTMEQKKVALKKIIKEHHDNKKDYEDSKKL